MAEIQQAESVTPAHHASGEQMQNSSAGLGCPLDAHGEIELFDLWRVIVERRMLISMIFLATLLVVISYAFAIPPIYRSSIHFLPQKQQIINTLNIIEKNTPYTSEAIYQRYQNAFKARSNLWEFFNEKKLYKAYLGDDPIKLSSIYNAFNKAFIPSFHMEKAPDGEGVFVRATLDWRDASEGTLLLNEYSQKILAETAEELTNELNGLLAYRLDKIDREIGALRKSYDKKRAWQLENLDENIQIAKSLGYKRPLNVNSEQTAPVLFEGYYPLFYSGYEVLEIQKKIVMGRKDNDAFTPGLEKMIEEQAYLQSIKIPEEGIQAVQISQRAIAPSSPIKPNKKLIVVFGVILGLFLGIIVAVLACLMNKPPAVRN